MISRVNLLLLTAILSSMATVSLTCDTSHFNNFNLIWYSTAAEVNGVEAYAQNGLEDFKRVSTKVTQFQNIRKKKQRA